MVSSEEELPVLFPVPLAVTLLVKLLDVEAPPAIVELEAGSAGAAVSFSGTVTIT